MHKAQLTLKGKILAHKKHQGSDVQADKSFVRDCWRAWQKNKETYSSKAAFARDMLTKVEHLKSQKKIEDWCRQWERESN